MKRSILFGFAVLALSLCGCRSVVPGAFSVAPGRRVRFAEGNLQYCPASNHWRFARSSVETLDEANAKLSPAFDGYVDLFAWGATGKGGVAPTETDPDNERYGRGSRDIADSAFDFGCVLSDSSGEGWRLPTHDEVHYLLMFRPRAEKLFAFGRIDGKRGLFILPDDWTGVEGIRFVPASDCGFKNQYNWYWSLGDVENPDVNRFSSEEWEKLRAAGAVFLPVTGIRAETNVSHVGLSGHYWTSSHYGAEFANCLCLFPRDLFLEGNFDRSYGLAVRLIRDVR